MIRIYVNYRTVDENLGGLSIDVPLVPNPHCSGDWNDGFDFTNVNLLLLAVL